MISKFFFNFSNYLAVGGFNGKTFLNTIEFLDADSNEWTSSIMKNDTLEETLERCEISDFINNIHAKNKNSLTNEPLVEVEESTVGH